MIGLGSRLTAAAALAASAVLVAAPPTAGAKKKKKDKEEAAAAGKPAAPACGISFLPLTEGAEWTYKHFVPDNAEIPPGQLHVDPPPTLTVRVDKVTPTGDGATITVTESFRKMTVTRELTCTKDALQIPIDSFFFSGEPGGGIGIKIDKVDRKGDSFVLKGGLKENTFQEFRAVATRVPTDKSGAAIPPAALEVERKMTVAGKQPTESDLGEHKNAIRVDIELTGRAALDTQKDKPLNMATIPSSMWFQPGVGLVRVESRLGWGWRLTGKK
ncbi:MAG TPA: hypothetical protein VFU21_22040 [Kofleriaceae bacterium]|nr:hypothetical protein [Kofleriaceae bacterium]